MDICERCGQELDLCLATDCGHEPPDPDRDYDERRERELEDD